MKKQPLIYKLNTIGGAVIIFLLIRTYVPPVLAKFGLNSNMTVWLGVYCLLSAAACLCLWLLLRVCVISTLISLTKSFQRMAGIM